MGAGSWIQEIAKAAAPHVAVGEHRVIIRRPGGEVEALKSYATKQIAVRVAASMQARDFGSVDNRYYVAERYANGHVTLWVDNNVVLIDWDSRSSKEVR